MGCERRQESNAIVHLSTSSHGSYLQKGIANFMFVPLISVGVGTPSDQGLAHSTEELGASPLHLASMEKRKVEPLKPHHCLCCSLTSDRHS